MKKIKAIRENNKNEDVIMEMYKIDKFMVQNVFNKELEELCLNCYKRDANNSFIVYKNNILISMKQRLGHHFELGDYVPMSLDLFKKLIKNFNKCNSNQVNHYNRDEFKVVIS